MHRKSLCNHKGGDKRTIHDPGWDLLSLSWGGEGGRGGGHPTLTLPSSAFIATPIPCSQHSIPSIGTFGICLHRLIDSKLFIWKGYQVVLPTSLAMFSSNGDKWSKHLNHINHSNYKFRDPIVPIASLAGTIKLSSIFFNDMQGNGGSALRSNSRPTLVRKDMDFRRISHPANTGSQAYD